MIRPLRTAHRVLWPLLVVVLIAALVAAIAIRRSTAESPGQATESSEASP